ncbi:hypothetical protein BGW80DRAFT_1247742 [Lactifluus volemus]|nr:hypothetical protein BGW80DRAFT_1247742 [Lactifluus volemus]
MVPTVRGRPRGRISPAPRVTIGALSDDVLLDIFRFCVPQFYPVLDYPPKTWYDLVHVCQRWRFVVFASPLSLDLHLYCTPGTPVREGLDVWPPLPITIWSGPGPGYLGDNVIAALEHPDRVREIWLFNLHPSLGRLITAMQKPFPALENLCLEIDDKIGQTVPALANTFLDGFAPHLQSLTLNGIPFPTLPRLLLSSNGLSRLHLRNIPHSGYISPEELARAVSTLTRLTYLDIGFKSPASYPDPRTQRLPPLTPAVLPALTTFKFHGVSEYLEDLVAQIDAPLLEDVDITLFNQLIFNIRHLPRFVGHTSSFTPYNRAEMTFHDGHIVISLLPAFPRAPNLFRLELRCRGVDWQVSSMEQICGQCSFLLSGIDQLDIRGDVDLLGSTLQVDMDNTQWLEPFHPSGIDQLDIRGHVDWLGSTLQADMDNTQWLEPFHPSGIDQLDIRGDVDLLGSTLQVDMDNTQWLEPFHPSGMEQLDIRGDVDLLGSTLEVDMDNTLWLELFRPFTAVQTLSISRGFHSFIASALQGLSVESVSEVLPALGELHLEGCQVSQPASKQLFKDIKPFITARQRSGRPVSVHPYLLPVVRRVLPPPKSILEVQKGIPELLVVGLSQVLASSHACERSFDFVRLASPRALVSHDSNANESSGPEVFRPPVMADHFRNLPAMRSTSESMHQFGRASPRTIHTPIWSHCSIPRGHYRSDWLSLASSEPFLLMAEPNLTHGFSGYSHKTRKATHPMGDGPRALGGVSTS